MEFPDIISYMNWLGYYGVGDWKSQREPQDVQCLDKIELEFVFERENK